MGYSTHCAQLELGCQTQKVDTLANVTEDVPRRTGLTPKGERTRARIVDAAARLIYERGVAGTTLEHIRAAAEVSGSQLSHYFAGKDELVQAVIDHQAGVIVGSTEQAGLATIEGLRAWRDMVVGAARSADGRGGCPLGALGSQLAETDPQARDLIASGFERWSAVIADGLRALSAAGHLPAGIAATTSRSPCSPRSKGDSSSRRSSATPVPSKPPSTPSSLSRASPTGPAAPTD